MQFLIDYWEVIFAIISLIASIVVMIISKKSTFQHVVSYALEKLPEIIKLVEEAANSGALAKETKKETALSIVVSDITARYGKLAEKNIGVITKLCSKHIYIIPISLLLIHLLNILDHYHIFLNNSLIHNYENNFL